MRFKSKFSEDAEPVINVVVSIPALKTKERIRFLIDTGASHTSLNQNDAENLGVDINKLPKHKINVTGVGGEAITYVLKDVYLIFKKEKANLVHLFDEMYLNKGDAPSVLGRDFLNEFKLFLDWKKDIIIITDEDILNN